MEAHSYRLRRATTGEWVAGLAFLPLTIPLAVLTAGEFPGSDIRFGGGSADPNVYPVDVTAVPSDTAPAPLAASTNQRTVAVPLVAASTDHQAVQSPATRVAESTSKEANATIATPPSAASQPVVHPNQIVNPNALTNQPPPFNEPWAPPALSYLP